MKNLFRRIRVWYLVKLRMLNVQAHGAYGDGLHDDTAAFQSALDERRDPRPKARPKTYRVGKLR